MLYSASFAPQSTVHRFLPTINMPNKKAKIKKQKRRKLNETLNRKGRTSIQYRKYLKKLKDKVNV